MPAALADVDWSSVRATFAATGSLKEAAIAHGIEEPTVRQRAHREQWQESRSLILEKTGKTVVSRGVTSPHAAIEDALAKMGREARIALAKTVLKGADHASNLEGNEIITKAGNLKSLGDLGKTAFGWDQGSTTPTLRLELIANAMATPEELPAIDVIAQVTQVPPPTP